VGGARPEFGFFRLWYLANDTPIFEAVNVDPRTGAAAEIQRYFRTSTYGFFAQDDWKVRPNLTINLGLRYEYFTPLSEKEDRLSNFVFGPAGQELTGGRVEITDQFYEPDRNNFAPRFGFAWSPNGLDDKFVLRGGFGISYNRLFNNILSNVRGNPPFLVRHFICCAFTPGDTDNINRIFYAFGATNSPFSYPPNVALAQGIDPVTGGPRADNAEVYAAPANLPNARVYSYSFEGQYDLPFNLFASLGYQGSTSRNLIRTVNQNFIYGPDNPKFYAVYLAMPDVSAKYNALLARLSRRFANGFQVDANYRLAKSVDELSFEFGGNANQTNPRDLASERGPSDFDVRHNFTLSGLWDLPIFRNRRDFVGKVLGGWQINGILTAHSGFPWTPKTCNDLDGDGQGCYSRPTAYLGGALDPSIDNLTQPGGIFPGGGTSYFNITTPGQPGIGRNSFRGPRYFNVDFSLAKQFGLPEYGFLNEGARLDIRANFFNAFNTLNLQPFNYGDDSTQVEKGLFGRAAAGLSGRVIELQVRFSF
jgi:outer membrane receptor protein involved in Fe transport